MKNILRETNMKDKKAITLIALVITIIVLLILAGISISMLSGNNGILIKTTEAREQTIISQEKEEIGLAYSSLVGDNVVKGTEITDRLFKDEINKNRGANDVSIDSDSEDYIVYYENTGHTYLVDKYGNITLIDNIEPTETIYVTLYSDGTLAFSNNNSTDSTRTVSKTYTIEKNDLYENFDAVPWKNEKDSIQTVTFVNKIIPTSTAYWFINCSNLSIIKNIKKLNTSKTTNMANMFYGCSSLTNLDVSNFDTRKVTSMHGLFNQCSSLTSLNLSNFDTKNVTDMVYMFIKCSSLTSIDLSNLDTSSVTSMKGMFSDCNALTSLDLSNFDTSKVTDMHAMFNNCYSLTILDLSSFDTSKVTDMYAMFHNCYSLTILDLSSFNTENVKDMSYMIQVYDNINYIDIDESLKKLITIYVSSRFITNSVTNSTNMFNGNTKLTGENGTKYSSSYKDKTYARIDGLNNLPGYFTYKSNSN